MFSKRHESALTAKLRRGELTPWPASWQRPPHFTGFPLSFNRTFLRLLGEEESREPPSFAGQKLIGFTPPTSSPCSSCFTFVHKRKWECVYCHPTLNKINKWFLSQMEASFLRHFQAKPFSDGYIGLPYMGLYHTGVRYDNCSINMMIAYNLPKQPQNFQVGNRCYSVTRHESHSFLTVQSSLLKNGSLSLAVGTDVAHSCNLFPTLSAVSDLLT